MPNTGSQEPGIMHNQHIYMLTGQKYKEFFRGTKKKIKEDTRCV